MSTSLVRPGYHDRFDAPPRRRGGFLRFVVTVGIGVAGTLTWQSYGDLARERFVSAYPQLGWLASRPVATGAGSPRSVDQQIQDLSAALGVMRQRVEQLSMQVTSGQDQVTRDITARLQTSEREILDRIGTRAAEVTMTAAARKPPPQAAAPTQLR